MSELNTFDRVTGMCQDLSKNSNLIITNGEYVDLCEFSEEHEEVEYICFTYENDETRLWAYTTSRDNNTREAILAYARNKNINGLVDHRSNFLTDNLLVSIRCE